MDILCLMTAGPLFRRCPLILKPSIDSLGLPDTESLVSSMSGYGAQERTSQVALPVKRVALKKDALFFHTAR